MLRRKAYEGQGTMAFRPKRLKEVRTLRGLSQEQLGLIAKMTQSQIHTYEQAKQKPRADGLERLARALDCSVDYLLGLTDDPVAYLHRGDLTADERAFLDAYRHRNQDAILLVIGKWLQEKLKRDPDLTPGKQ